MRPEYTISQETVRLSSRRPLRVQSLKVGDRAVRPHDHEFYEVALVKQGQALHCTASGRRSLRAGDLIIVAPGQVHGYEQAKDLQVYNLYYLAEWLLSDRGLLDEAPGLCFRFGGWNLFPSRVPEEPWHDSLDESCRETTLAELGQLAEMGESELSTTLLRGYALKCFALWHESMDSDSEAGMAALGHPLARHVFNCIESALAEGFPCDVAGWARRAGCSSDHLSRVYKQQTGESPVTSFQRRRLQQAGHALIYSQENLSQIAHRLGFADSAHFSRQFKDSYGMSPKRYRARFC